MASATQPSYVPALRMKSGELGGLRALASDVADRVLPRMVVPPAGERDQALEAQLFKLEDEPNIADALAAHWRGRSVLVDATYLLRELGRETVGRWLPRMLERARHASVPAIPMIASADLTIETRGAYQAACASGPVRLGIVVPSGHLVGRDELLPLLDHLSSMGLSPADCAIVADFADAEFSQPEIVAPIIGGALELLQELGLWRMVIFQGTNYPDKNPASAGGSHLVPRTEWMAWRQAVQFDQATAEHMIFGDYAADCATMAFGDGGGRAIRHYRYTTPDAWLVHRGEKNGPNAAVMQDVCRRIVDSGQFAGRTFSSADDYIFRTAYGRAGPGNAANWRAINTTHHITRVIADIGHVRGFALRQAAAAPPPPTQRDMFVGG
ncbi:beta family protein [Acidisoma sp. C75]